MARKPGYARPLAALIALIPCLYSILFSKWVGVDLLYQSYSATLWKIGKLLKNLAEFAESYGVDNASAALTAASVFLYLLFAFALVTLLVTIRSVLLAFRRGASVSVAGFYGSIALCVVILLLVWVINGSVSKETDGWIDEAVRLTSAPYITLLCSVAGCLCCKFLPKYALQTVAVPKVDLEKLQHSARDTAGKVSAAIGKIDASRPAAGDSCEHCGRRFPATDFRFCPYCGKEHNTKRFCEECGKELDAAMQFCPYCGTPVRKDAL